MEQHEGLGDETPVVTTGDARIDEAIAQITELTEVPIGEHASRFETVHQVLQDRLADVGE